MVDRAPEVAELAVDLHKELIQMPAPLRIAAHMRDASLADLGGEHRAKPVPPEPDGLMADVDPELGQQSASRRTVSRANSASARKRSPKWRASTAPRLWISCVR